jgi:two-component system chemotaxis response regulator CheB
MATGHRLIAIAGSAGAIEALTELLPELHPRFPAPIVVAIHSRADGHSNLVKTLGRDTLLTVEDAVDGAALEDRRVYVTPPAHHAVVRDGHLEVRFGPRESGHRRSLDVLLRSAALAYGPEAIGVILSGVLDDGVAGLQVVKTLGGVAVVQDPADAKFSTLPLAALRAVDVHHQVPAAAMPSLFEKILSVPRHATTGSVAELDIDSAVAESLLAARDDDLEVALWAALRALEDQADLASRMERQLSNGGPSRFTERYSRRARRLNRYVEQLRHLLRNASGVD